MIALSHTLVLVLVTAFISFMALQNKTLMDKLLFYPRAIRSKKEYYRFLTYGFIHADLWHFLFNMFTLYSFGRIVEQFFIGKFGNLGFIGFYVLAVILSAVPSFIKQKNNAFYRSLGASGAVSAVLFSYILFAPWSMLYLFGILPIPAILFAVAYVGYSAYANKRGTGDIEHLAHLSGALFGVLATVAAEPWVAAHFVQALLKFGQ